MVFRLFFLGAVMFTGCQAGVVSPNPDSPIDSGIAPECTDAEIRLLDSSDIRMRCSLSDLPENFVFTTDEAWQAFLGTCVGEVDAPSIDFSQAKLAGAHRTMSCPFAGSPVLLDPDACLEGITAKVWTWTDHCFCDYFDAFLVLYEVPLETASIDLEVIEEATCDQTRCACPDGSVVEACQADGSCQVTDSYTIDVDGQPAE